MPASQPPAGNGHPGMTPPRVLLVEDDPSLRRFVAMALEGLDRKSVV